MQKGTWQTRSRLASLARTLGAEFKEALLPSIGVVTPARRIPIFVFKRKVRKGMRPLSALCISGGGIRSATFALGALQALAGRRVLEQFDYLSTVSGSEIRRQLADRVVEPGRQAAKRDSASATRCEARRTGLARPDRTPARRLQRLSFAEARGVVGLDTWTLAATILRNILLNWMVRSFPLLMAAMMLPRLFLSIIVIQELLFGNVIFGAGVTPQLRRHRTVPSAHRPSSTIFCPI